MKKVVSLLGTNVSLLHCCQPAMIRLTLFSVLVSVHRASCVESSNCYDEVNVCFYTDGSLLTQPEAQTACHQRNSFFLSRVTDRKIQSKLAEFLAWTKQWYISDYSNFWIDVRADVDNDFHWLGGSSFARELRDQADSLARFAAVVYDVNNGQFVYSARRWDNLTSSYICQLPQPQGTSCGGGGLSLNANCYKKFHVSASLSWFNASNRCLYVGGSLAVLTDVIGRQTAYKQLNSWLNTSGTDKTYWIGLVRPWWKTTDEGGRLVDLQYSSWSATQPVYTHDCVLFTLSNNWNVSDCYQEQQFICQNYTRRRLATSTAKTPEATLNDGIRPSTTPAFSASQPATDIVIPVAVGVGVPSVAFVVALVLFYRYKLHSSRDAQLRASDNTRAADSYVTPTDQLEPDYDVIRQPNTAIDTEYLEPHDSLYVTPDN